MIWQLYPPDNCPPHALCDPTSAGQPILVAHPAPHRGDRCEMASGRSHAFWSLVLPPAASRRFPRAPTVEVYIVQNR